MLKLYTDGGCIKRNPSPHGGSYGIVIVQDGKVVEERSGTIDAHTLGYQGFLSNNVAELYALSLGILMLPCDVPCGIYSDSENALGRVFQAWKLNGVPGWLCDMVGYARMRLRLMDQFEWALVQGHPNKKELELGETIERRNKDGVITRIGGLPVSEWNVYADGLCTNASARWLEENKVAE